MELIDGFTRAPYCAECGQAAEMDASAALETASMLEDRSSRYYAAEADKLKAQPEVARALKLIGKNTVRQDKIGNLSR